MIHGACIDSMQPITNDPSDGWRLPQQSWQHDVVFCEKTHSLLVGISFIKNNQLNGVSNHLEKYRAMKKPCFGLSSMRASVIILSEWHGMLTFEAFPSHGAPNHPFHWDSPL